MKIHILPILYASLVLLSACTPPQEETTPPEQSRLAQLEEPLESVSSEEMPSEEGPSSPAETPESEEILLLPAVEISPAQGTPNPSAPDLSPVIRFTNNAPEIGENAVQLGEALMIHVSGAGEQKVTAQTSLPFQPQFYPDGEGQTAFLPIAYTTSLGTYPLTIQIGEQSYHYSIQVADREFEVQNLTIDEGTASSTNTSEANWEWEQKIEPLKRISDSEKYWDGNFIQPVEGEITTEFGMIRYTNGSTVASRHSGIDIAAKRGTQIAAANNGRIQFAGYLQLTGYTAIIEHGFGLKSFYYHMDSLDVEEGQIVQKGDPIGKVGSTGYSTGPHLHYSLLVNNVFINPWTAFAHGF